MRAIVFFFSVFFFLLVGKNNAYAGMYENHNSHILKFDVAKSQSSVSTDKDQNTVIEDSDVDLEEESHISDQVKNSLTQKFNTGAYNLTNFKHALSGLFVVNHYYNHFKIYSRFCGYSSPIYISQRVLRI